MRVAHWSETGEKRRGMSRMKQGLWMLLLAFLSRAAGHVITVNTSSSSSFLSLGRGSKPILLEFYAPWCGHCTTFAPVYKNAAVALTTQHNFVVGACDSSTSQALAARFDVFSIPSIFLLRDGRVWRYDGVLLRDPLVDWATRTHKSKPSISFFLSPLGPMGLSKAAIIRVGEGLTSILDNTASAGLPKWAGFLIVASLLAFSILSLTFLGVYVSVKFKQD